MNTTGNLVPRLSIFLVTLTISACTMIPKYERPAAPVSTRYPGTPDSREVPATADIAWRDFFIEDRLRKLLELALINNRNLRVALLNVEQSRAQYRVTRSASVPAVSASGTFTRQRTAGSTDEYGVTPDQFTASVGITAFELDFFGRVRSLNAQALEKYLATDEARRSTQISLVAETATQYFTMRQTEEQIEVARQTVSAVMESYRLNKILFDTGASNELDLRAAEGQLQTAQVNVAAYERQFAQAQNALVLLIGQALPSDLPTPLAFDPSHLLADVPSGLPSDLVQRRPDILQAEHTLKAANANIGAARAAFFPNISLTSSIGAASSDLSRLFSAGTGTWSFSPQIMLPIFNGGKNRANLDAAEVGTRIEVANYEKSIQIAFREVADALAAGSGYAREMDAQAASIRAQRRRLEIADVRYRHGEDSYLNVLLAQQALYGAQQALLQAQLNKLSSQISLYKALGGGWR